MGGIRSSLFFFNYFYRTLVTVNYQLSTPLVGSLILTFHPVHKGFIYYLITTWCRDNYLKNTNCLNVLQITLVRRFQLIS